MLPVFLYTLIYIQYLIMTNGKKKMFFFLQIYLNWNMFKAKIVSGCKHALVWQFNMEVYWD